jgi:hypothetical protein
MSKTLTSTPAGDGLHMPGEFEPHSGCWMLWPERTSNWRLGAIPAQKAFASVAAAIAIAEPVTVGASRGQYVHARAMLPDAIRVVEISSDDAWMRDVGPTFVVGGDGTLRGVDWVFNAWGGVSGGLYFPWDQDDLVARKVLEMEGCDRYRAPFVLEGGAIHVDGEGTLITTEECLMNPNRNAQLDMGQLETLRTRPAVTWTTCAASSAPGKWRSRGPTTRKIRNIAFLPMRTNAYRGPAMRRAANSRSTRFRIRVLCNEPLRKREVSMHPKAQPRARPVNAWLLHTSTSTSPIPLW